MFDVILPIAGVWVNMGVMAAVGLLIGFVSGLFGVGGGFLMTPILIFLGVPPSIAVATGSAQLVASASFGSASAFRNKLVDHHLSFYLLIGAMIGTGAGIGAFNILNTIGRFDLVVAIAYVVLLGAVGGLMLKESIQHLRASEPAHDERPKENAVQLWLGRQAMQRHFPVFGITISLPPLLIISILIGFIGTILGVGGGFMFVPALIYLFRLPTRAAVAASQVQILATMVAATVLHAVFNHAIDVVLAIPLILGGVIGAHFGITVGRAVNGARFRLLLALLILSVALRFLFGLIVGLLGLQSGSSSEHIPLSALPPWEGWIALVARDNALPYGLATMVIAVLAGFGANFIFNRK